MEENLDRDELLAHEPDILQALLRAADRQTLEPTTIEIVRKGQVVLSFRILPLSEREFERCREEATTYKAVRKLGGITMPDRTDTALYRSLLVYAATVDEDRRKLWDNKAAQQKLNVVNGSEMVDQVLLAGEKDRVVAKIEEISGYGADLEETVKN